jgi:hypothetical protein
LLSASLVASLGELVYACRALLTAVLAAEALRDSNELWVNELPAASCWARYSAAWRDDDGLIGADQPHTLQGIKTQTFE